MDGELLGYYLENCVGVKSHTQEREQRWGQGRRLGPGGKIRIEELGFGIQDLGA
jgi:hypothetical protein